MAPASAARIATVLMSQLRSSAAMRRCARSLKVVVPGSAPRKGRSPRNDVTASKKTRVAGSSERKTWFRLSRGTNLAPGIPAAISWPSANDSHVALAMGDQRRRLHLRQEVGDVDLGELDHESLHHFRRRGDPLQVVEPARLLGRAFRDELRGEPLPVGVVLAAPALAN